MIIIQVNVFCVYRIFNEQYADKNDYKIMELQQNDTRPHPIQLHQNACYDSVQQQYVTLLVLYTRTLIRLALCFVQGAWNLCRSI